MLIRTELKFQGLQLIWAPALLLLKDSLAGVLRKLEHSLESRPFENENDDEDEELELRGEVAAMNSESELQKSNISNLSDLPPTLLTIVIFLLRLFLLLFLQNLSLGLVGGLDCWTSMRGLGSPKLITAGGGVIGGIVSSLGKLLGVPGCISQLNGTPSVLLQ